MATNSPIVDLPSSIVVTLAGDIRREAIGGADQLVHDTRLAARMTGITNQPEVRFRPGSVNIPGGPCWSAHVVSTLNQHGRNMSDLAQVPDDLVVVIKEAAIDKIMAFDTGEGRGKLIGIDIGMPVWIGP